MWTIAYQRSAPVPRAGRALAFVAELFRMRHLVASLAWRDVRVRYAQSLFGIGWAVALPLVTMLVFVFVFTRAIDSRATLGVGMPYALYAYTGIVPWTFFAAGLTSSLNSLVANRNLVTKVYFPREVFPLSCVLASLVDFAVGSMVLLLLMSYMNGRNDWTMTIGWTWLFLPLLVVIQTVLTAGLGMILALTNLFFRDVRQAIGVLLQLVMFVSAVVVPIPHDGSTMARFMALNPMVVLLESYRCCLVLSRPPDLAALATVAFASLLLLTFAWYLFRKMSPRFAECI